MNRMIEALLNIVTVGQLTNRKASQAVAKANEEIRQAVTENKEARVRAITTVTENIAKATGR